ncbi:MAG: DnaJ domain-containing protein, partial [Desulforhopalus sp.]
AYRTLSMQYHPDKVRHLGDEFRAVAENKMKEINAAYDYFKKQQ